MPPKETISSLQGPKYWDPAAQYSSDPPFTGPMFAQLASYGAVECVFNEMARSKRKSPFWTNIIHIAVARIFSLRPGRLLRIMCATVFQTSVQCSHTGSILSLNTFPGAGTLASPLMISPAASSRYGSRQYIGTEKDDNAKWKLTCTRSVWGHLHRRPTHHFTHGVRRS